MHKKEGQISAFILLGIVLLFATALIIYLRAAEVEKIIKPEVEEEIEAVFVVPPLENYVQNCIIKEGKESILELARHGGTLNPRDNIYYNNTQISYLCYNEGVGNACISSLLLRQDMEAELALDINNKIKQCVDLSYFEREYKVEAGMPRTAVKIGSEDVVIALTYPINLTREQEVISVSEFKAVIGYPLGKAYDLAVDIVNEEISNDFFDKDSWMAETGTEFLIEKHRPYPNMIYVLSKEEFVFQFGLQGFPSVAQYRFKPIILFDACFNVYDNKCFMNALPGKCQQKGLAQIREKCPKTFFATKELCDDRQCRDCVLPDGQIKKHTESWCGYDSITGNGYDYVGSRHYLHTCIDGRELVEECRDYREGLCTQTSINGATKAVCRPNRWQSCSACTTRTCCENSELRDCVWSGWLDVEQKCHPAVPPGLRFWLREGSEVCFAANDKKECSGLSCPNRYIDTAAISCYYQGDCGNYRNIADDITYGGFFESDIFDKVRDYVYLPDGYNSNPTAEGKGWVLNLPLDTRQQKRIKAEYETPLGNIPVIISAVYNFVDEIDKLSITDLINPFREKPALHILDVNYCDLWMPPLINRCNLCTAKPKKPCSEYKCMSLGQNCIYEEVNGSGICRYEYFDDRKAPVIFIDREVISEGYEYKEAALADYTGFEVLPDIEPHKALTVGIVTSEETRCKINYGPRTKYYNLPSFYFGTGAFAERHNITFRSPPRLSIPPKVLDVLNFSASSDFLEFIDRTFEMYDYYKRRLSFEIGTYKSMTGKDPLFFIDPIVQRAREYFERLTAKIRLTTRALFEQFDQGGYYLFINCIDRGGNENTQEFFIKFKIKNITIDTSPPEIVRVIPPNGSKSPFAERTIDLRLYMNEPSDCRYNFADKKYEAMNESFDCVKSGYALSPIEGGTYECQAVIPIENKTKIFIRCKDNPAITRDYHLNFFQSANMSIEGMETFTYNIRYEETNLTPYSYINISPPNKLFTKGEMLKEQLSFGINSSKIEYSLYLDDRAECLYSNSSKDTFEEMQDKFKPYKIAERFEKGIYRYDTILEFDLAPKEIEESLGRYSLEIRTAERPYVVQSRNAISIIDGKVSINFTDFNSQDIIEVNESLVVLTFNEIGNYTCKYSDIASQDFGQMPYGTRQQDNSSVTTFSTENKTYYFECVKFKELEENKTFDIYIKCAKETRPESNVHNKSFVLEYESSEKLEIIGISPKGVTVGKDFVLSVNTTGNVVKDGISCGYRQRLADGLILMDYDGEKFKEEFANMEKGFYSYYITCSDRYGNTASDKTVFEVS